MSLDYLPVTGAISTGTVPAAVEALGVAKQVDPEIVTLIGGPHPTFMYEEMLAEENTPLTSSSAARWRRRSWSSSPPSPKARRSTT